MTATKATRATRPLIAYPMHFERVYCHECMNIHMAEVTHTGRIICHGEDYYFRAQADRTHYSRHQGKGFELVPMNTRQLDWIMAQEAQIQEPEYVDIDQDW